MKMQDYFDSAFEALSAGRISQEAFDAIIENAEIFCEDDAEDDF